MLNNPRYILLLCVLSLFLLTTGFIAANNDRPIFFAGSFSTYSADDILPDLWESLSFRGKKDTEYRLHEIDDDVVIKAESDQSASGLIRRLDLDPKEYPVLRWSWRAENILEKGDVTEKSGDDYPARIYVTFNYDISNLSWWDRTRLACHTYILRGSTYPCH